MRHPPRQSIIPLILLSMASVGAGARDVFYPRDPLTGTPLFGADHQRLLLALELEGWELIEAGEEYLEARRETAAGDEVLRYSYLPYPTGPHTTELNFFALDYRRTEPRGAGYSGEAWSTLWTELHRCFLELDSGARFFLGPGRLEYPGRGVARRWGSSGEPHSWVSLGIIDESTVELSFHAAVSETRDPGSP